MNVVYSNVNFVQNYERSKVYFFVVASVRGANFTAVVEDVSVRYSILCVCVCVCV
jgi:hypothetical protein